MINVSGNCSIPFGLFGSSVPDHVITSVEIINNKYIITGDEIGQIIIWKINTLSDVIIYWYLLGHTGKISNICNISTADLDDYYFVTFSLSREISVWNCLNGKCIKFERNTPVDHLHVLSYKPSGRPCNLLICCGKYPGIHVLDSFTLKPTMHLKSQGYPNWIKSICAFEHQQAGVHVVLGLSVSGAAILWTIEILDGSVEIEILYETESRLLNLESPMSISMCSIKPRFVLVISGSVAQIYDAANWTLLCHTRVNKSYFIFGRFIDLKTVMLQLKDRSIRLYRVPIALDTPLDMKNDFPLYLEELCLMGSLNDDTLCHTVNSEAGELTLVSGDSNGIINIWNLTLDEDDQAYHDHIAETVSFSLPNQWSKKHFSSLTEPLSHLWKVTCSHYSEAVNMLVLGMENGDIVLADMLHTLCVSLFPTHTSTLTHRVFHGHTGSVLSLVFAETISDDKKIHSKWLWSGSADFSVRLWDFDTGKCVQLFHCHSGPVKHIFQGPNLGLTRAKHDGHIRAQRNKENVEQEVLKPINARSWFGAYLYVSTDTDNGVAFLSLETKRVVMNMRFFSEIVSISWRREHIVSIIECADGTVTVWELADAEMSRFASGQLAKDLMESSTDRTYLRHVEGLPTVPASVNSRLKRNISSSLMLHSVRTGIDKYSHIIIIDSETLLVDLYKPHTESSGPPRAFIEAQLLLALANQWGTDPCLDKTLESSLGLVPMSGTVSNGYLGFRFGTMSFQLNSSFDSFNNAISTSQKLLVGVAISHALNSHPENIKYSWVRLVAYLKSMYNHIEDKNSAVDSKTTMRQVYCLFATSLVTFSLTSLLFGVPDTKGSLQIAHVQLVLQQFLQKYQDRCLEIREAARTLFHASMDSLTSDQRADIVRAWVTESRILELSDDVPDRMKDMHRCSLSSINEMPAISDWRSSWNLAELYDRPEITKMQVITTAFLAAVGSRYGSMDSRSGTHNSPNKSPKIAEKEKAIPGFGIEDYRLARITCGHLMRLLTQPSSSNVVWPEMRRLAITLLGQGFPVWEPYLEVGTLFAKLLEIVAGAEKTLNTWIPGQLLSDEMDACRSARGALRAISLSRPKVFATVLSIEVLRLQMQTPATTTGPGNGLSIQKSTTGTATSSTTNSTQPPLLAAKHEVVEVIKVLCERKTREMHEVLPEIMDVLLTCLNKLDLRQFDLQQLFPPILLFRIASSHTASGKVCVGTRTGHLVFYDVKLGKYNTSPGHRNAVTSVTFSPDGKQVASYSMPDNSVCIWQLFSSGLFGMGSNHQVKLASSLNVPPVTVSQTVSEEDSSLLLWLEWYENRSIHLVTNAGLVNKINL